MLREQELNVGPYPFLSGRSEMGRLIAATDWSKHPFGPIAHWPQSLQSALSICLQSKFPTAIYWGRELRLLYNDAWSAIPGPRHPGALGARAQDVWSDIWDDIAPQFREVIATGEGMFVEDRFLPMARFGAPEETYWSYSFTPIRGEDGTIAGIFNSGSETTHAVLAQRQMRFFLDLSEHLRLGSDLSLGRATTLKMLGQHLGVAAALVVGLSYAAEPRVIASWSDGNLDQSKVLAVIQTLEETLRSGEPTMCINTEDAEQALCKAAAAAGWGAVLAVPMGRASHPIAIVVAQERPRAWTAFDSTTISEALERMDAFRQRLLAQDREEMVVREVDHRARNAMMVAQSIVNLTFAEGGEDVADKIRERLAALGRAQALLSKERWRSVDFAAILDQEFAPFPSLKATCTGPSVPLGPGMAQTLSLIIHELATNSVKYGAMGQADGQVSVVWDLRDGLFTMNWTEQVLVPRSQSDAVRTGFGTTLIDRVVRSQLRGRLERHLSTTGFACRLEVPFISF
ncbi:MAG: PAS domain-containing protein [Hyphomicrobium sp.]|nr:PAS domain-containing protein [Hyphomicrobium sp.]